MAEGRSISEVRRARVLEGSLRRTMFLLALPVLCEQFLSFLVGFYDTWLSGRFSSDATTAIGITAYTGWLASLAFSLVGTGTTALVARHWGAGEFDDANHVTNRSVALSAVLGVAFYALLYSIAPLFSLLLGFRDDTGALAVRFLRIDGAGYLFSSVSLVGAAALRGAGNMRAPMLVLGFVSVLNVFSSYSLVYGVGPFPSLGIPFRLLPRLGVDGIVVGTLVARFCGGVLMLVVLASGQAGLKLVRKEITLRGATIRRILRIGGPAALDGAVMWIGQFLFLMIIASLDRDSGGSATFAAHIVGIRVEAISYLPAVAWGMAGATIIGQSLGAGDRARAYRAGHEAALQCALFAFGLTIAFFAAAGPIYSFMHEDPAVRAIGVPAFRFLAMFQVPLVASIVYVAALRGAGDTRYPMLFTLFSVMGIRLPLGYLCGVILDGGLLGAWIGMCSDVAVRAVLLLIRYTRGRWLSTAV